MHASGWIELSPSALEVEGRLSPGVPLRLPKMGCPCRD